MALKHLRQYYDQVCADYKEAIQEIKEFEEECANNLVPVDRVDQLKETMAPLLKNYEQISYLMFLLNMPNKKEKQKSYNKVCRDKINAIVKNENTPEALLKENRDVLGKLKMFH